MTITCGPFVGSFFEEIIQFRPFVQWIQKNLLYDELFVFTHGNRSFMYDLPVIPIFEQYSIDDTKMINHRNKDITTELYKMIFKSLKKDVIHLTGLNNKEIVNLYNKHTKHNFPLSEWNKEYQKIEDPKIEIDLPDDYVVFIPFKKYNSKKLKEIYDWLQTVENVIIIGDSKIHFKEKNFIKEYMWYDLYQYIVKIINNCKMLVCPLSKWTFLANLQQIPVISWGKNINPYKSDSVYGFNNENCIFSTNNVDNIISQIKWFRNKIKENKKCQFLM